MQFKKRNDSALEIETGRNIKEIMQNNAIISFERISDNLIKTRPLVDAELEKLNNIILVSELDEEYKLNVNSIKKVKELKQKYQKNISKEEAIFQYKKAEIDQNYGYDSHFRFYTENFDKMPIESNKVVVESYGHDVSGSMLKIMEYFQKNFSDVKIYVISESGVVNHFKEKLNYYNINATILTRRSANYYREILSAKYLITDTTFENFIAKRPGQIMINTWHGVPLKHMGFNINNRKLGASNIQRNFYNADLIVQGSAYSKECMRTAFSHFDAKLIGTPRNDILHEKTRNEKIREELGIKPSEKVVLFAPTWHGNVKGDEVDQLNFNIAEWINHKNNDNIRIFYKPHQSLMHKIKVENVEYVPAKIDVTDFLNCTDILVTDYSSIMFDFAILNRPIILHVPTLKSYVGARGLYVDMEQLPFTKTATTEEIWSEINNSTVVDYSEFNLKFNTFEDGNATERMFDEIEKLPNKKNSKCVAIYPGKTKEGFDLLKKISPILAENTDIEIHILIDTDTMEVADRDFLNQLPENVKYYCFANILVRTRMNNVLLSRLSNKKDLFEKDWQQYVDLTKREIIRSFGSLTFDTAIDLSGENLMVLTMLTQMSNKTILCYDNELEWMTSESMTKFSQEILEKVDYRYNKNIYREESLVHELLDFKNIK